MTPLEKFLAQTGCEVRADTWTRQLYATDASLYQIQPAAVAFPRSPQQASSVICAAAQAELSLIPRGAGTGLVGGAIGDGLVIDFALYNRQITDLNLEKRSVRVGAGVVLDQLNAFLKPHGYGFGPDVATSSRATLGGMLANNSSGARTPLYGTTADHVLSIDLVLADGRIETVGPDQPSLPKERDAIARLLKQYAPHISEQMPPGLIKRWPGYALDRAARQPDNLTHLLCGSEGTLAAIVSAELNIVPLPKQKSLGLIFFASVAEAMQATVELLPLKPAAIEHIDRILFDQTKHQLQFAAARDLLELDQKPCESILLVEFYDDVNDRLQILTSKKLGLRTRTLSTPQEMNLVWALRKAGLSLLTGRKGAAKPVTGIEDTAVRPEQLPAYVAGLQSIMQPLALETCYYGHAASGLLHVRPVLNLRNPEDRKKFRHVADQVSALVRQFKGSLAAEHGVGIARTQFLPQHLGPHLSQALLAVKNTFDPHHRFNPGKIINNGAFRIDSHLRVTANPSTNLPFEPVLAFAAKDGSFTANLDQCNGCGGCRKETPAMCPTFLVTHQEELSTRGRANTIRAALETRCTTPQHPLQSPELERALSQCLSCKACATECPSNVDLALLKAELLHARYRRHGFPARVRLLSSVDTLGRIGCLVPQLANRLLKSPWLRSALDRYFGLSQKRPLPTFATTRFDHWFLKQPQPKTNAMPQVILWDDTFLRYHEPHIGHAAVRLLQSAGVQVQLPKKRQCCGRPAFSQGHLAKAASLGFHNLQTLSQTPANIPILFLEPSCYSMFIHEYRELKLPGAQSIAQRCFLFEQFIELTLRRHPHALPLRPSPGPVALHAHCHAKSSLNIDFMIQLIRLVPGAQPVLIETGCCGMAGAFGMSSANRELSIQIAQTLIQQIQKQPPGTPIIASGTSCRHQIQDLTATRPLHMAEWLAHSLLTQ